MTDVYFAEASSAAEAIRIADNPNESIAKPVGNMISGLESATVEEIKDFPDAAIVCTPDGDKVSHRGTPMTVEEVVALLPKRPFQPPAATMVTFTKEQLERLTDVLVAEMENDGEDEDEEILAIMNHALEAFEPPGAGA